MKNTRILLGILLLIGLMQFVMPVVSSQEAAEKQEPVALKMNEETQAAVSEVVNAEQEAAEDQAAEVVVNADK